MKDYVREENCKFYVNKEKRRVVCVYDQDEDYIDDEIITNRLPYFSGRLRKIAKMPARFTGVANCAIEDKWDEAVGRRVAFLKMCKKYYHSFFKAINRSVDYIDGELGKFVDEFNTFGEKVENSINREQERLQKVIGNPNE